MTREGEETWVRLLLAAVDQLAWVPDLPRDRLERSYQEVKHFERLATRLGDEWNLLDLLREVAGSWRALAATRQLPAPLVTLIPHSWTRPLAEVRPRLVEYLAWVAQYPHVALNHYDRLRRDGPAVLSQFGNLLEQLQGETEEPPEPEVDEAVTRLTLEFLGGFQTIDSEDFRGRLLDFCLGEALPPERVAQVSADRPELVDEDGDHLSELLLADWPLRFVALACRLFWA
jgi:hypothetical protein